MQQKEHSDLSARILSKNVLDSNEVLQTLAHLPILNVQVPTMQEILYPLIALIISFTLSYLIVMMRKPQVNAS
jgi:hypothetical protein